MVRTRADLCGLQQPPTPQVLSCWLPAWLTVPPLDTMSRGDFHGEDEAKERSLVASHRPGRRTLGRGRGLCAEAPMLELLSLWVFAGWKLHDVL